MICINYNNENYIEGGHILLNAPIYSKGCRSSRDLIKKKIIESIKYIYARLKENIWIITDGKSVKFDKVFFKKSFINTIPELKTKKESDDIITDQKGIETAPNIIKLDDIEKFKDENNNIIEIETRGERSINKIYFKVKDVMEGFKMECLNKTIIDKYTKYIEGIHYKYFNCQKVNKIKKELFLTYEGFQHVIFLSKNKCINNNTYIMKKWLDNFDKNILNKYQVDIQNNIILNNVGFVYIVSSNLLDAVKIGMWRSCINSLYSRYKTYYGNNTNIDHFLTNNARELENKIHKYFIKYKITNELFDKIHYNKYINYIQNNIEEIDKQIITNNINELDINNNNKNEYIEQLENKIKLLEKKILLYE